jgi:hypothetical protein
VHVPALGPLGDQSLPAAPAGVTQQRVTIAAPVRREAHPTPERHRAAQRLLTLRQRPRKQILAVELEQVEQVQVDRDAAAAGAVGIADLHPSLQPGEAGLPARECHDLAVGDQLRAAARQRVDELG